MGVTIVTWSVLPRFSILGRGHELYLPYRTIPYSFNNVADMRNLQQYCLIEHYQFGRTKVYDSYIVKET